MEPLCSPFCHGLPVRNAGTDLSDVGVAMKGGNFDFIFSEKSCKLVYCIRLCSIVSKQVATRFVSYNLIKIASTFLPSQPPRFI